MQRYSCFRFPRLNCWRRCRGRVRSRYCCDCPEFANCRSPGTSCCAAGGDGAVARTGFKTSARERRADPRSCCGPRARSQSAVPDLQWRHPNQRDGRLVGNGVRPLATTGGAISTTPRPGSDPDRAQDPGDPLMPDATAPYRADEVGSLLRSAPLKEARAKRAKGEITPAQLRAVEDEEIRKIARKQEELGLKLATDGEFRRTWWQFDFFEGLDGVELYQAERGIQFKGIETTPRALRVTGKLDFPADHPMLEHFKFLSANTKVTPKMTVPAPANLHFRNGRKAISREVYPDLGAFFDDLATVYGKVIRAFHAAGCRYLQLDDTTWGYLCSAEERALARTRGDDNVDELPRIYAEMTNRALKSKPADM